MNLHAQSHSEALDVDLVNFLDRIAAGTSEYPLLERVHVGRMRLIQIDIGQGDYFFDFSEGMRCTHIVFLINLFPRFPRALMLGLLL